MSTKVKQLVVNRWESINESWEQFFFRAFHPDYPIDFALLILWLVLLIPLPNISNLIISTAMILVSATAGFSLAMYLFVALRGGTTPWSVVVPVGILALTLYVGMALSTADINKYGAVVSVMLLIVVFPCWKVGYEVYLKSMK